MRRLLLASVIIVLTFLAIGGCCCYTKWSVRQSSRPTLDLQCTSDVIGGSIGFSSKWHLQDCDSNVLYSEAQWASPDKKTAAGVVFVHAPVSVTPDLIYSFAKHKYSGYEGVTLRRWEENGVLWFEANDPQYYAKGYIICDTNRAWIVYAGHRNPTFSAEDYDVAIQMLKSFQREQR